MMAVRAWIAAALVVLAGAASLPVDSRGLATLQPTSTASPGPITMPGPGWVSVAYVTDGAASVEVTWNWTGNTPFYQGIRFLRSGEEADTAVTIVVSGLETNATAFVEAAGLRADVTFEAPSLDDGAWRSTLSTPTGPTGEFVLLWWIAGRIDTSDISVEAAPGATVTNVTHGSNVFGFRAADIRGTASVSAGVAAPRVRANLDTYRAVTIDDQLFGTYLRFDTPPTGASVNQMEVTTPTGTRACPCGFDGTVGPRNAGPGRYVFRLTGVGAATFGEIVLTGADAMLAT